jgi:RHS repeat-associated protein
MTTFGGQTLTYDANGNLTNDGSKSYTWDARNRLSSMTGASFVYDPLGRRVSKTIGASTTSFLYDGQNPVQEGGANLLTGLGVDQYFTRTDSAGARSFLTDALGSSVALADNSGAVQTQYTYEPFGKTTATGATNTNTFQYTGRENDGTGLAYYRARYYHASLQRFISEDPIGFAGGDTNLYAYTHNQPISFRDPSGLCYDPGGGGIRYCVQAFIPSKTALWVFKGDNRSSTCNSPSATYRSFQWSSDGSSGLKPGTTGDIFGNYAEGVVGPSSVDVTALPLGGRKVHFQAEVTNGLIPSIAPPLWYDITIAEGQNGNASLSGASSSFPGLEVCQYGGPNGTTSVYFPPKKRIGSGLAITHWL